MKEIKDVSLKVRITSSDKEQIDKYCEANDIPVSQFVRMAIREVLNKKGENNK